jgi:dihydrofolate reductase
MRRVVAAINMTLDGYCDHTAMVGADDELRQYFIDLLRSGGALLYGRTTYQLMEDYWPSLVKKPSGNKFDDDFAVAIHEIPKIVFSRTLQSVNWETARIAKNDLHAEVLKLKQQPGQDIFVGSPSLIVQSTNAHLIDEYQLTVHPVLVGKGLPLFKHLEGTVILELLKTKCFNSGCVTLYYTTRKK